MKKAILSLGAAALVLSFASCKKDYVCTCKWTENGVLESDAYPYPNVSRGDAHDACDIQEGFERAINPDAECEVGD